MANLKTLKTRIKSVKSTQKMTKAMKMVAASRLKKAKHAVELSRPYSDKINEMVVEIASNISVRSTLKEKFPLLTGKGQDITRLILIMSSDRGLCGGLNSATVKYAKNRISTLITDGYEVKLFCIGKKAYEQLKFHYGDKISGHIFGIFRNVINFEIAEEIVAKILTMYNQNEFDSCEVIYSKFKSAISQEQISKQIIPIPLNKALIESNNSESPIEYEPNEEEILSKLLPENLSIQIFNELLENSASEQGQEWQQWNQQLTMPAK